MSRASEDVVITYGTKHSSRFEQELLDLGQGDALPSVLCDSAEALIVEPERRPRA